MKNLLFTLLATFFAPFALASATPSNGAASPAGPATISLAWQDNADDETGYELQRHGGDFSWTTVANLSKNSTSHYDRGLITQSTYSYRVRAIGSSNSAWLDLESATTTIKMNLIFFLADDMGYKDIVGLRNPAVDGPSIYQTPALDQLVKDGLSIENAYCSGPRCVVARRSLLSGKYDWRPEAIPNSDYYLDHAGDPIGGGLFAGGTTTGGSVIPNNVTYGEATNANFRTCYIGKYHLGESPSGTSVVGYSFGDSPARGPNAQGFDVSIGSGHAGAPPASYFSVENMNDTGNYTFELPDLDDANYGSAAPVEGEYITDRLTSKAIGFIDDSITNHSADPFFLTLAHYAVHTPAEAKATDISHFRDRKASMSAELAQHPMAATPLLTDYSTHTRMVQDNIVYAAMLKSYDDSLASLRAHLAVTDDPRYPGMKLSETTVIIVSSDHGGKSTSPTSNGHTLENDNDTTNPAAKAVQDTDTGNWYYKSGTPNSFSSYPTSNYPFRQGKTWVYEGGLKIPLIVYYPGLSTANSRSTAFVHGADFFASFVDIAGTSQQTNQSTDSISFLQSVANPELSARDELHHFFTNANKGTGNPAIAAYRKGDYKLLYFMVQRRLELYNLAADVYEQNDLAESRPELAKEMLKQVYDQFLSTTGKMPKPGSNTWVSEQSILVDNGVILALPTLPDAAPSDLVLTATSPTTIELNWTVNANNSTHSIVYRRSDPDNDDSYREIAYLPAATTTYTDSDLIAEGNYRYRIESENFAGWATANTGNKTLTLPETATALSATANDDDITTLPGEMRIIYPLINDEGEGALTITSITTPLAGTATTDGTRIFYTAAANFAGSDSMDYTLTDAENQTSTATIHLGLPIPDSGTTLEHWDFNESDTTQLESTQSSNGLIFNGSTSSSVATNGAGVLILKQDTKDHYRNSNAISSGAHNSGKFTIEYHISSLNLENSPNGAGFGFGFRDGTANEDFGLVRFKISGGDLTLEAVTSATSQLYIFSSKILTNTTVSLTLDLDTQVLSTQLSINGAAAILLDTVNSNSSALQFDTIKFQGLQKSTKWDLADSVSIDSLTLTQNSDEPTLYSNWATAYPWDGEQLKAPNDDPDGDGISNLIEFAFGLTPTVSNTSQPFQLLPNGNAANLVFTPVRDTTALSYSVEFSNDLSDWESINPYQVSTPSGTEVDVPLPEDNQMFGRVSVNSSL